MPISKNLKQLRREANITQKELASQTGIPLRSIINYENGLREPNSKAMAVLERYFKVNGDVLRGNIDREAFLRSHVAWQTQDDLVALFQSLKPGLDRSSSKNQRLAISVLNTLVNDLNSHLLSGAPAPDLSAAEITGLLSALLKLNRAGRAELAKRAEELTQLAQYQK